MIFLKSKMVKICVCYNKDAAPILDPSSLLYRIDLFSLWNVVIANNQ